MRSILATSADAEIEDLRWYLTLALRRHSELVASDRWETSVYRTQDATQSLKKPEYDHVVSNKWFCDCLLNDPQRWGNVDELRTLLRLQVTCLVTHSEHGRLGPGFGWQKYLDPTTGNASIVVLKCDAKPFSPVNLAKLVEEQLAQLKSIGLKVI